jgi:ADP-ribose pyrophosphatase YjhB (NUDIX family)
MPLPTIDDYPRRYHFRFCPLCAAPLERRPDHDRIRLTCPVDGWTFYPAPNLAATVVVEHESGVVLLKRAIEPDLGIWHLPIGHIEYGETPAAGALRETAEETGLMLDEPVFLDFEYGPSYEDRLMYYLVFCYRAKSVGGSLRLDHENSAVKVFAPDEMPELKWSSQRRALAAWRAWRAGQPWMPGQQRATSQGETTAPRS